MAAIHCLLNPTPDNAVGCFQLPSPSSTAYTNIYSPPPPPRKKQKIAKDAAVFTHRASIQGECRYPPCENQDEVISFHHRQHEVYPMGHIAEYPRHIPYNSEKKTFQEKTGRESFEVFHYEFRIPGEDKVHCMMWDYNIGLVRTTPLFRCNGYSKTTPARMLNRNPGLRELCHSITGGALVAQGYWMPFEAAKAIAATFCYHMRYALTPVFGRSFPDECIEPDSEGFGEMVIDESITRLCQAEAMSYRRIEIEKLEKKDGTSRATTPIAIARKQLRPKGNDSGHGSEPKREREGSYRVGTPSPPKSHYLGAWTPANTPRTITTNRVTRRLSREMRLPSPREILATVPKRAQESHGDDHEGNTSNGSSPNLPEVPLRRGKQAKRNAIGIKVGHDDYQDLDSNTNDDTSGNKDTSTPSTDSQKRQVVYDDNNDTVSAEENAAHVLLSLKMGQTSLPDHNDGQVGLRRRCASA